MRYLNNIVAALIFGAAVVGSAFIPTAEAQMTVFRPSYAPVVVAPPPPIVSVPLAPATVYHPAIVAAPVPYGVARPIIVNPPLYAAPRIVAQPIVALPPVTVASPVTVARPVVPTSVLIPAAVPRSLYRPAVVGPGVGGLPNVYVPGQPVRNALRFALP